MSLTGSVPKLGDLEYELFRDTGGQVPELSQPTKLTDSFPPAHEFLFDLHTSAPTPPMRSPTGSVPPPPFQFPLTRPLDSLPHPHLVLPPPHQAPTAAVHVLPTNPTVDPRLLSPSSFAMPPAPHTGGASADSHPAPAEQTAAGRPAQWRPPKMPIYATGQQQGQAGIKRGAEELREPSVPASAPQGPTRKKGSAPEEKAKLRAEQSRTSSRLYRLRKKAYQQTLEQQLDAAKEETTQVRKELEQAKEQIAKLQDELASLRAGLGQGEAQPRTRPRRGAASPSTPKRDPSGETED